MKRYHYKKWFSNIMNHIPIRIVRVLVAFFMIVGIIVHDVVLALVKAILNGITIAQMKEIFGDVWYWNERGEKYDGHVGGH